MPRSSAALLGLLLAGAAVAGEAPLAARVAAELEAARKTRVAIEEKLAAREGDLETRVRALYKLTRGGLAPLWVDERARSDLVQRRAAARRMILRDLEERRQLRDELAAAGEDERRLEAQAGEVALAAIRPLPKGGLARPVSGRVIEDFGPYKDKPTGARLVRRGVVLAARAGDRVVAALPGTVLHAGPVRGLGTTILLDHGEGLVTVVGGLGHAYVSAGQRVERAAPVGEPQGDRVYLEVRLAGRPVDPGPLLAPR